MIKTGRKYETALARRERLGFSCRFLPFWICFEIRISRFEFPAFAPRGE